MRVLFTGGRSPATLALLRLFAQAGHHCQVAESLQPNLAGASRYCRRNHTIAPPRQQMARFVEDLERLIVAERIELLIPTCEETFYVSRYRRQLEAAGCQVFTAGIDVLTNLHSKYQFNQLLQALKLPAPASARVSDRAALDALLSEWGEAVLKPEFSRFASAVLIKPSPEAIRQQVQPSAERPWVLQEYLPGRQYCSYSVAHNGRLQAHAVYPTVYAMGQGATIYFESVAIPEIEQIVQKLVASLDYSGQISFDFIHSREQYYPIECNPRTTTGTFLFEAADGLPQAFFGDGPIIRPQAKGPVVLTLPMLLYALPADLRRFPQIVRDLFAASDPLMQLDDLRPFLAQFGVMGKTLLQARRLGTGLMAASTHDIEWNGSWAG
ncbi:MAG: ATP-grasp domain-containing protein [Candidatus Sericytochromatia bacterium]